MCIYKVVAQRWGQRAVHVCRERGKSSFAEVTGPSHASLAFLIGIRFLKVHKGFIPAHAPRELSIAVKEMQKVGRITNGPRGLQGKLSGDNSVGAAVHLGRSWIYLSIPIFHLGFM